MIQTPPPATTNIHNAFKQESIKPASNTSQPSTSFPREDVLDLNNPFGMMLLPHYPTIATARPKDVLVHPSVVGATVGATSALSSHLS